MTFARSLLKPAGMLLLLLVLVFSVGVALAEDPVELAVRITPDQLTGPGEVTVSLEVSNASDLDMIAPVTLYDPAGNPVTSFGDGGSYVLKAGEARSWEGKWNVTQAQLDAGAVTFTARYHIEDESGALVEMSRQTSARIQFQGERANLTVTRKIEPQVVRPGSQATVTYELRNSGTVHLNDIRVQENISKTAKTVKSLAAGESVSLTFNSRMGNSNLTSNATITYKVPGESKTQTVKVEDAVIASAKPDLKLALSSPTDAVNVGDRATLVITFTNAGNVSYSNVTVTDAKLGDIVTGLEIPAGQTVTEERQFILSEAATFKVTATLPDNTGETKKMTSNELRIGVYDPEKQLLLTLNLTSDQDSVPRVPADVRLHLKVTNNSNIKAEKIAITHGSTAIYTIASLEPGASVTLDRDVTIPQAGQFRFTATLRDALNNEVKFESNTIRIIEAPDAGAITPVPVVTVAPPELVTSAPVDPLLTNSRNILRTVMLAMMGVFGAALALFAVSSLIRLNKLRKSKSAFDHLELAERRDYTEPADDDGLDDGGDSLPEEPEEADVPVKANQKKEEAEKELLPHEKLLRSAAQTDAEKAPAPESMPPVDGMGGYRVTRAPESAASAPAESAPAEKPAEEGTLDSPRRHRRASRRMDEE